MKFSNAFYSFVFLIGAGLLGVLFLTQITYIYQSKLCTEALLAYRAPDGTTIDQTVAIDNMICGRRVVLTDSTPQNQKGSPL